MKNKKSLLSIVSIGVAGLLILALAEGLNAKPRSSATEPSEQLLELQNRVDSIEEQLKKTIGIVNRLSEKVRALSEPVKQPDSDVARLNRLDSTLQVLESATAALSNELVRIQRQVTQNARRASYTDSINFEILSQLVILENRIVSLGAILNEKKAVTEAKLSAEPYSTEGDYRDRYLQALTSYQNGDHETAIQLFRQLLNEDKYHELADNAQYWIGECFYSMKQYRRAIVEFEKVFAFKNSNKEDDAQFKLGLCYAAMGERNKAIDEFQRLIDYYPQSEYVNNAKQFMKQSHD
ncbi:MAG TPA: tetratricopeptide repeat protein [Candidatus Marinimicrobia bacterium]|nr:tetratricopeptide repeat protein [Candidatus Neomarinimicrobiota bacterium]